MSTLSGLQNLDWSPKGLLGNFGSMGTQATTPQTNLKQPSNVIPSNQATPNTSSGLSLGAYNKSTQANNPGLFGKAITNKKSTAPVTPPAQPVAQASYQGGQVLPAVGSAVYTQAQNLAHPALTPSVTPTVTTPQDTFTTSTQNLSNTTPSIGVTTAQTNLNNQATSIPQSATQAQGLLGQFATTGSPQLTQTQNNIQGLQNTQNEIANNPNMASEVASGRGQALTGEINAAQTAYQNALANNAQKIGSAENLGTQALTGQAQNITAAQNEGSIANTAQGNQITGQYNAGSLSQPTQLPYGTQYGTPQQLMNGQGQGQGNNAGGSLNPLNNVNSIAQQVINHQISPSQAYSMGGNIQNWQGVLNQAIQQAKPGFDTAAAEGSYTAKQQNTTTAGTTPTSAAASLYQSTYPQLAQIKTTTANIGQFGNLLLGTMVAPDGTTINPTNAKYANQTIAQVRSQLSSPQQAQFDTTFTQLRAQIASLLSTGGSQIPSQTTQDANAIIDGSAPLGTLNSTLQRIETEGNILTTNLQGQLNSAGSAIGAPTSKISGKTSSGLTYTIQ